MTPQSFSSLITTLIKYLVYEKQLIPYPYDRLKLYMQKYKELNFEVSGEKILFGVACNSIIKLLQCLIQFKVFNNIKLLIFFC